MKPNQIFFTVILFFSFLHVTSQNEYQKKLEFLHERITRTQYSKLDSMRLYIDELKNSLKENDSVWLSRYHSVLGVFYQQKSNYEAAKKEQFIALEIGEKINEPLLIAKANQRLGVIYKYLGDFDISMEYFFKARDLSYSNKDTVTGVVADLMIGQNYWKLKKYNEALTHINKATEITENKNLNNDVKYSVYLEKGNMLLMFGKLNESLETYEKAVALINNSEHLEGLATVYSNMGAIHFYKNDFNKAISYYNKGLEYAEVYDDLVNIAMIKMNLGEAYYNLNQFKKSENLLNESLELHKQLKDKLSLAENYRYLYELETKRNNAKKALEYFKLKATYKDSVLNENNLNKISSLEIKYETAE